MIEGGTGGNTTLTGLKFENKVDLITLLKQMKGYNVEKQVVGNNILFNNKVVARCFKKYEFYKFLEEHKINHKNILSKKLLPDDALLVIVRETLIYY